MLKQLKIKNLAIIEDIQINFDSNFTALTGATGAGKSLVIDSLKLIFGKRADSDYIRHGQDDATIIAIFSPLNNKAKKYLESLNILDEQLVIERWISRKDRNKVLINDRHSTLKELQELGYLIGDIHEQFDTTKLLDPNTAINMIDQLGRTEKIKNEYTVLRYNYLESLKKYNNAVNQTEETKEKLEQYKFEHNELSKAKLDALELEQLEIQINTLSNQKEIVESLSEAYNNLSKIDEESLLYGSFGAINKIKKLNPSYEDIYNRIESNYYELNDVKDELYYLIDSLKDTSLLELESMQERFFFLKDLEKKYKMTIEELIDYHDELDNKILQIENFDGFLDKLNQEKDKAYADAYKKALELSEKRKLFSKTLEKEFVSILKRLDIMYVDFKVSFNNTKELLEDGIDIVEFLISLNEGEPLKPFYKVASGGELSRSMLALKILFAKIEQLSLMVFDEIDLGISGDAASKVAAELKSLSKDLQVISITHLPQVAAASKTHYNILKQIENNRTITVIENLDFDQRVYHIAYMLSGKNLTEGALLHAKSLLGNKKSPKAS